MDKLGLDKYLIDIKCPKCSRIIAVTIGELKKDRTIICPNCNEYFDIQEDEIKRGIENIEESIKKIRGLFKIT